MPVVPRRTLNIVGALALFSGVLLAPSVASADTTGSTYHGYKVITGITGDGPTGYAKQRPSFKSVGHGLHRRISQHFGRGTSGHHPRAALSGRLQAVTGIVSSRRLFCEPVSALHVPDRGLDSNN